MTNLPSSKSGRPLPAMTTPSSVDPRHIDLLIARTDAPVASSLHALPSDAACRAVLAELRPALALLGIEGAPIRELAKALGVSATKTRTLVAELRAEGTVS